MLLLSRKGGKAGRPRIESIPDDRLTPSEERALRESIELMGETEASHYREILARHSASVERLGPLEDPDHFPALKILTRAVWKGNPAGGPIRQDCPASRSKESHP